VILVPSPNVAEDHQTKNALALVRKEAAIWVTDREAEQELIPKALEVVRDEALLSSLSEHIRALALPDSAERIVDEIIKIMEKGV
ncbi:MAG: UDP-N-acetylglucosamine--N-acetylmuramyl-(pentapeptide) pyrophosphoryl-undecaprenol N-acetylglucosamine transferase, partial [Tannerellaceae bacterium]|nr:UDP-N-acetylglucosamine--N-acetylmuramyl-(pentapeptide) pyrophosphoryl-undecaprenol N-acetylglucosamine transferase [Tannerellaceae bacterium]